MDAGPTGRAVGFSIHDQNAEGEVRVGGSGGSDFDGAHGLDGVGAEGGCEFDHGRGVYHGVCGCGGVLFSDEIAD